LARLGLGGGPLLTRPGEVVGTPEYMAPEQCAGRDADARADVYAVGIILYELSVGRPPFAGSAAEVHHAHRHRRPTRTSLASRLAPALEAVVLRCLAKEPERRYADATELRTALAAAVGEGGRAETSSNAAPASRRERRPVALVLLDAVDVMAVQAIAG